MLTMYPNNAASLQNCDWKIFTHPDYGYQYVRLNNYFRLVNQFAPFVSYGDAKNTELKIIPAEIIVMNGIFATDAEDPDGYDMYDLFNVNARPQIYENTNNTSFKNLILKDETEKSGDVIQVAYYAGIILHRDQNGSETREGLIRQYGYGFPVCFTQQHHIYIYFFAVKDEEVLGARNMSLELNGTNGLVANVYENEYKLDITQKTTVLFKSSHIINPNCIFHIAGRQFLCKQLKYTFSNGKRHPVVEGVFFPYNS